MCLEPLAEGRGVDLHDGGFRERVCAHELVVGRVVGYVQDAGFARGAFGAPGEVAAVQAEAAVFVVAAPDAHDVDAFGTDAGVGWLTAFFEGSEWVLVVGFICVWRDCGCTHLFLR